MILVSLRNAGSCTIGGVNLDNACTQPIVTVDTESKMLPQVADLASGKAVLEEIHLQDVLLLAISPCKPCLSETHVAPNADQRCATAMMLTAGPALLGLSRPHNLDL